MSDEGNDASDCKSSYEQSSGLKHENMTTEDRNSHGESKDSDGIEMVVVTQAVCFKFVPLTYEHKTSLCKSLGIGRVYSQFVLSEECATIGRPDRIRNIQGDGNCFFQGYFICCFW